MLIRVNLDIIENYFWYAVKKHSPQINISLAVQEKMYSRLGVLTTWTQWRVTAKPVIKFVKLKVTKVNFQSRE